MTYEEKAAYCRKRGYSDVYLEYWQDYSMCEVEGCTEIAEPPHHIRTRGAGGLDVPGNLLAFGVHHHRHIHNIGPHAFAQMFPQFADKIRAALNAPKNKGEKHGI
jgi:hypothetical protein